MPRAPKKVYSLRQSARLRRPRADSADLPVLVKPAVAIVKEEPVAIVKEEPGTPALKEPETASVLDQKLDTGIKGDPDAVERTKRDTVTGGPPHWRDIYELVREMRQRVPAPVDTMGCEKIPDHAGPLSAKDRRFHLLITLMLSSQTKDEVNAAAMASLRAHLADKGGLCLQAVREMPEEDLDRLIYSVGFHTKKASYIKSTCEILASQYDGDIPVAVADMTSLPGVGPKMAFLLRSAAWDIDDGIGVDVHVHRLANMWGWVPKGKCTTPEKTRIALESWLPRECWREINGLLVGFGQTICPSRAPKCGECTIASTGLCKAAKRSK